MLIVLSLAVNTVLPFQYRLGFDMNAHDFASDISKS